jgi:hypothetical protein
MLGCINAGTFIYQGAINTYNQLASNLTLYGSLVAFNVLLDPVYHIADINYQCFVGAQEAYQVGVKYTAVFNDPMTIV